LVVFLVLAAGVVRGQTGRGLAEVMGVGTDLRDAGQRARVVSAMRLIEAERRQRAREEAGRRGLAERSVLTGGRVVELADWVDGQPLYLTTANVNAAISTGANLLGPAPYGLFGAGLRVGVWDGGAVLAEHQEFGGRVTVKDGAGVIDHATHVAGTMAAAGAVAAARGMASSLGIDSYDWNSDTSEMTARGAVTAGDTSRLFLSNHSYNYISGWNYVGSSNRQWEWYGAGTTASGIEDDFGRYNTYARDADSLAYNAPYYLMVRSAGNERTDAPSTGQLVALSPGGSTLAYDPAVHPKGDGAYRGGFDTIGFNALAKNVLTVGSVTDAVVGGGRDPSVAAMSGFSSWGPTDDGRIKPDVVANGDALYSSTGGSDKAYGTLSGTSMASPNACGSAALLVELYGRLFPGQAMRASTLKGVLLHTASDLGRPGPDYKYGWGLVNVKAGADLIQGVYDAPERPALIESSLTSSVAMRSHAFTWDGSSPIRVTLCWTDPAGAATTTSESRTPRLVNNLNLKVVGPGGVEHSPFVMPFVGTWTQASMDLAATTGVNTTDTVEQVFLAAPPAAGLYQAVVSHSGTLTNSAQNYSLILSGTAPSGPLPPSVVAVTPDAAETGIVPVTISGSSFAAGAAVKFTLAGQADVAATVTAVGSTALNATVNTAGMATGQWNVVVTNPDGQSGTLPAGFAIIGTLWKQNFDASAAGWAANASVGSSYWALVNTQSHSPSSSWFASGPSTRNTDNLVSESIAIPTNASRLRFSFWHRYSLESGNDGGLLEFSVNGGAWYQVTNTGVAEAIIIGGYPMTLSNSGGNPSTRNQFAGRPAWSGNSGSAFTQVVVALNDTAKYAGKSLRARWRLGTNSSVASPGGWYVDSVALTGVGGVTNQPPSLLSEAEAETSLVTGDSVELSVSAADDGGESSLTYTWSATGGTFDRPVDFSENGNNGAQTTTAIFQLAGPYTFQVIVRDAAGLTTSSTVDVTVVATPTVLTVAPAATSVVYGSSRAFAAASVDQFGDPMATAPAVAWAASGGGTIDDSGVFMAQAVGGPFTVTATASGLSAEAAVTVERAPATVVLGDLAQTWDGSPRVVDVVTDPPDLPVNVTYDGQTTAPTDYGSYAVSATIADPNYTGSAGGVLSVTGEPLDEWIAARFTAAQIAAGQAADDADTDRDGLNTLTEYALGSDPLTPSPSVVGTLEDDGLALRFTRPKNLPDVVYLAEASSDLIDWIALPVVVVTDGPVQSVRAVDPSSPEANRRFVQLRIVRPAAVP
jgi:hypothetical protein